MLLSKEQKEQFKIDHQSMTYPELGQKYLTCYRKIWEISKDLGLPRKKTGRVKGVQHKNSI